MKRIDLHVHTTASDSTASPREAVEAAKLAGLSAIAITDHDTVSGYREASQAAAELGVEIVPGIEISTKYGTAVHILGYYIAPDSSELQPVLDSVVDDRNFRNRKMAELMAADGLSVSYELMQERFGEVIGRPHFARICVELGLASDVKDAFSRYVGKGMRYYVPRTTLKIDYVISLIRKAGGIPVLAHPFQYKCDEPALRELIEHCIAWGLEGLECLYAGYSAAMTAYLEGLAEEYGLLRTGGSDFHGANKPSNHIGTGFDGELCVPYEFLQKMKDFL